MNVLKDIFKLIALALIVRAVYHDSVACAIAAGTLYMGGFDDGAQHLRAFVRSKLEAKKIQPPTLAESDSNLLMLRR